MFNGAGKTDILIRVEDRNVFIAECKFWHGPKKFTEAIDQLLSYTTWRETKAARAPWLPGWLPVPGVVARSAATAPGKDSATPWARYSAAG